MHDPQTVAFEIKNPFVRKRDGYRPSLITIWHCDPEIDGSDDSCGWFIRSQHIEADLMNKVQKEFDFQFKHNYWFDVDGTPKFSTAGTALEMFSTASWIIFMHQNGGKPDRKRHVRFMRKHLFEILHFAENPIDSLYPYINMIYGFEKADERCRSFASIVAADIMRKQRHWWQHPKWHIHHWRIQFHPIQRLKRRFWDKCSVCGKRGFTGSAYGNWGGDKIWHEQCNSATHNNPSPTNLTDKK